MAYYGHINFGRGLPNPRRSCWRNLDGFVAGGILRHNQHRDQTGFNHPNLAD